MDRYRVRFLRPFWRYLASIDAVLRLPEARPALGLIGSTLAIGTLFYRFVEGWTWLDSLYFCVVTLATVGYGDLAPQTALGKLFTMIYILVGIGLLAAVVRAIAEGSVNRLAKTQASHAPHPAPPPTTAPSLTDLPPRDATRTGE